MGLFDTFDNVSHKDWMDKITTDLKGKDFNDTLIWNSEEGIDVQPFYNSYPEDFIPTPIKTANNWIIRETVIITSIELANNKALLALKGGANSILFVGKINNKNEMDLLLKDIQTDIIEVHFYNSNPKLTSQFVSLTQGSISYDVLDENFNSDEIDSLAERTSSKSLTKTITVNSKSNISIIEEVALKPL